MSCVDLKHPHKNLILALSASQESKKVTLSSAELRKVQETADALDRIIAPFDANVNREGFKRGVMRLYALIKQSQGQSGGKKGGSQKKRSKKSKKRTKKAKRVKRGGAGSLVVRDEDVPSAEPRVYPLHRYDFMAILSFLSALIMAWVAYKYTQNLYETISGHAIEDIPDELANTVSSAVSAVRESSDEEMGFLAFAFAIAQHSACDIVKGVGKTAADKFVDIVKESLYTSLSFGVETCTNRIKDRVASGLVSISGNSLGDAFISVASTGVVAWNSRAVSTCAQNMATDEIVNIARNLMTITKLEIDSISSLITGACALGYSSTLYLGYRVVQTARALKARAKSAPLQLEEPGEPISKRSRSMWSVTRKRGGGRGGGGAHTKKQKTKRQKRTQRRTKK